MGGTHFLLNLNSTPSTNQNSILSKVVLHPATNNPHFYNPDSKQMMNLHIIDTMNPHYPKPEGSSWRLQNLDDDQAKEKQDWLYPVHGGNI